ncbi:uncharacterized protein LOC135849867 [Planococcus citri]|uniref:uncharacterized protein LOC135849867 n=1 Tax=Planococcus citri TaxID=170843 RepID=UPI0031FA2D68
MGMRMRMRWLSLFGLAAYHLMLFTWTSFTICTLPTPTEATFHEHVHIRVHVPKIKNEVHHREKTIVKEIPVFRPRYKESIETAPAHMGVYPISGVGVGAGATATASGTAASGADNLLDDTVTGLARDDFHHRNSLSIDGDGDHHLVHTDGDDDDDDDVDDDSDGYENEIMLDEGVVQSTYPYSHPHHLLHSVPTSTRNLPPPYHQILPTAWSSTKPHQTISVVPGTSFASSSASASKSTHDTLLALYRNMVGSGQAPVASSFSSHSHNRHQNIADYYHTAMDDLRRGK